MGRARLAVDGCGHADPDGRRISAVTVASRDPDAMSRRWNDLGIAQSVRFGAAGERGDGIDGVDLHVSTGHVQVSDSTIGGVEFTLV